MKRYYIILAVLTLLLAAVAWWVQLSTLNFQLSTIIIALPFYFAVVTGLQHYVVANSLKKDPRTFIKNFLGLTVGTLFLHLVVLSLWAFTHIPTAKPFIIAFGIGFVVYLAFETLMLVLLVRSHKK